MNYSGRFQEFPDKDDDYLEQSKVEIVRNLELQHPVDRLKHINGGEPPPYESYPESADTSPFFLPEMAAGPSERPAFNPITPVAWKGTESPKQRWLAQDRIPASDVTILAGNGGSGKTEIATSLLVSVAAGLGDWMGCVVEDGPALFISCEEDESNVRERIERITKHRGIDAHAIENLHLYFPDLEETWLGSADYRTGRISKTPLLADVETWIRKHQPSLVAIDSVAAVFDGDAIARRQVRAFMAMLRKIAREHNTAILLLDHPSVRGMNDGSGTANSVDWRNSVRAMIHLSDPDANDPDARELEIKKTNRSRVGEKITLRWNGLTFAPEMSGAISPSRAAADRGVDDLFLQLLDKLTAEGREVRDSTGSGYAPAAFESHPDSRGVKSKAFNAAMQRLFAAGKIITVQGKRSRHIERMK